MYKIIPIKRYYYTKFAIAKKVKFRVWVFILNHEDMVFTLSTVKAAEVYINQVSKL
jgi:hypothetical protein